MEIVLSIIIGIVIAIVVVYLIWKQPIRISYSVNRYALVITNFCTFFFSIMCILYYIQFDIVLSQPMEIHNMIEASFIIFIKQGGGVLIITIVTGLSNRVFIQSNDLDRFDSYSTIVSRINYSIICSFSAFICFIESYSINLKRMDNPFFSQGIMWITVLIGTWISFEGLSEPRKNETEKINKDKNILPKDIIEYAISLFVGPITLIIVIVISYFWKLNIKQLPKCIYIIAFSFAISVIIMGLIINKIRNRSSESYKTRIYKKIKLKILEQNIEIDKKNEISKKGRKQLEEWFSMSYVFTYDLSRQGYNEMIQKLDEHSNNRKDALNKCYNQIRTNYFKKHKNCYCS